MAKAPAIPELRCACGSSIEIPGRRIGDTVSCRACGKDSVVLRSKVQGDVPPAANAPGAVSDRLPEVQESLKRIRLRQTGHAARDVSLYPTWALVAAGAFGFYLSAVLAGQNLAALGQPERARRVQVLGVGSYLALGALVLGAYAKLGHRLPLTPAARVWAVLAVAVAGTLLAALRGREAAAAAFDAGARHASVLVPALLGFVLLVAQFFVWKLVGMASAW
ncbi:hypothetical protein HY251_04500 [bacterium]|nr:hypothetical protein [bacterium]